jgi:hypothetical protein
LGQLQSSFPALAQMQLYHLSSSTNRFLLIPFAAGPEDVGDDIGDGRPRLVLIGYDAEAVRGDRLQIPTLVERIFRPPNRHPEHRPRRHPRPRGNEVERPQDAQRVRSL